MRRQFEPVAVAIQRELFDDESDDGTALHDPDL